VRRTRRAALLASTTLVLSPVLVQAATPSNAAVPAPTTAAATAASKLSPWLSKQLNLLAPTAKLRVAVRASTVDAAARAARSKGLVVQQRWPLVNTVVAVGAASQVRGLRDLTAVLRVDGDQPLDFGLDTAHKATRADQALAKLRTPAGKQLTGTGVSVAVIDSGIDGTHPFFKQGGTSKVVRNLKNVCGVVLDPSLKDTCFQQVPTNDTDTVSAGGHGTHVAGIAAGVPVTTSTGQKLRGSAPGAKLVGLSVGAAVGLLDAASAQNWVLEHQRKPCASAANQAGAINPACPPIRVTNHSYGPVGGEGEDLQFDAEAVSVQIQRALVKKGVTAVWAAGNSGGDGSYAATNPDAMDPTPGVVMVASYDDGQTGSSDNVLSSFSSRGKKGAPGTYPDVSAPGDKITSSCRLTLSVCQGAPSYDNGNYQTISGTSMASPYVAGVVATLVGAKPAMTPAAVEDVLEDTAHRFTAGGAYTTDPRNGTTRTSFDKGHGLVDVLGAQSVVLGKAVPAFPVVAAPAPKCVGTDLITDRGGDAATPVTGLAAPAQDITSLSFASKASTVEVTATYVNYSDVPAAGSTFTNNLVTWKAQNGKQYGVEYTAPGGGYTVGIFDPGANSLVSGTTTAITGSTVMGAGGTVTWNVPRTLIGSPVIPVKAGGTPAVQNAYGLTIAGEGAMGTGLVFAAPVDRAPDGGATAAWAVCA